MRLLPLVALVTTLGGCVGSFNPKTDAASPLAPRIQQLVDSHNRYPRWEDFPRASTDTPTAAQVAQKVEGLDRLNQSLTAQIMAIDWATNPDHQVFESMVQSQFDLRAMGPIGPQTTEEIEALAESLRRKATPPPRVDRPRL